MEDEAKAAIAIAGVIQTVILDGPVAGPVMTNSTTKVGTKVTRPKVHGVQTAEAARKYGKLQINSTE